VLKGGGKKSYAKVLKPDIEFEGNVVHVISSVLLPEGFDAYEVCWGGRTGAVLPDAAWMAHPQLNTRKKSMNMLSMPQRQHNLSGGGYAVCCPQAYYESLKSTKIAQKFWNATSAGDTVSGATVFAPIDKVRLCAFVYS